VEKSGGILTLQLSFADKAKVVYVSWIILFRGLGFIKFLGVWAVGLNFLGL
jgi:hypothetical protein